MSERTCNKCGETKPRKAFWGVNRSVMRTCTVCRQKEARRKRYLRAKKREEAEALRRKIKGETRRVRKMIEPAAAAVREIDKIIRTSERAIATLADKVAYGRGTKRTESALESHYQKVGYYEDVKEILLEDYARGNQFPLEHYLTNTYLLHKHGYPCVVTDPDPDPRSDRNGDHD